jgi:hypothetical protein
MHATFQSWFTKSMRSFGLLSDRKRSKAPRLQDRYKQTAVLLVVLATKARTENLVRGAAAATDQAQAGAIARIRALQTEQNQDAQLPMNFSLLMALATGTEELHRNNEVS